MANEKYETTGEVRAIGPEVTRGKYTSRKIHLAIDRDGKYPQTVEFEVGGKSLGLFDGCNVGDEVKVEWNLRGREWTSPQGEVKVFNTLSPWKVAVVTRGAPPAPNGGGWGSAPPDDTDIPF